jgi:hypothetical protein
MSDEVEMKGTDDSADHPIHSAIRGIGSGGTIRSTVDGTGTGGSTIRSTVDGTGVGATPIHSVVEGTGNALKPVMSEAKINRTRNIDPVAIHVKEVSRIDPVSIESLRVSTVRDIEPLRVEEVNVTSIPTMNHTVRHMPAMDMSVRRVPPMSVGLHQRFEAVSDYTLRASVLGFEVARLSLKGTSVITPQPLNKPERHIERNRSYPVESVAGNPTIPVNCRVKSVEMCEPRCDHSMPGRGARREMPPVNRPAMNVGTISPGGGIS